MTTPVLEQLLNRGIKDIVDEHPRVGEILNEYQVGCVACTVGTCRLKDVVKIHNLPPDKEEELMRRIAAVVCPELDLTGVRMVEAPTQAPPGAAHHSPVVKKLMDEHELIRRWVELIPRVIERMDLNSAVGRQRVLDGVDFIRSYADAYHHDKEEEILFKYFDENLDVLNVMRQDHEAARAHVRAVVDAVESRNRPEAAGHLDAYRELLIEHIKKENEILYPWIDRQLSDRQVGKLFSEFGEVDARFGDVPRKYQAFISKMERELGDRMAPKGPGSPHQGRTLRSGGLP